MGKTIRYMIKRHESWMNGINSGDMDFEENEEATFSLSPRHGDGS